MRRVLPPSKPPDGERPRCFCLAVVGGTQLRGSWYLSSIARLQGFSSGSPAASPRRWSPKTVTTSSMVGRSKPGCDLCPALSFKDLHHPCWGGGRGELELYLPHGSAGHLFFQLLGVETILQLCGGGALQLCRGRRTVAAQPGCNILSSVLVFVARTGVRTCQCALGRPALAGAVLVDRWTPPSMLRWWQLEKASPPSRLSTPPADRPPLFGFNIWFSSLEWGHEREPSGGSVRPGTIAAAVEVAGESPGVCPPAGSPMWRLFIPAGVEPEFRL
jgi:hypothetical protein